MTTWPLIRKKADKPQSYSRGTCNMKRISLVVIAVVLMAGCSSEPDKTTPKGKSATESKELDTKAETVYITKTGSKYHRGNCSYLKKSKITILKSKAIRSGFGACSRCKP